MGNVSNQVKLAQLTLQQAQETLDELFARVKTLEKLHRKEVKAVKKLEKENAKLRNELEQYDEVDNWLSGDEDDFVLEALPEEDEKLLEVRQRLTDVIAFIDQDNSYHYQPDLIDINQL